MYNWSSWE